MLNKRKRLRFAILLSLLLICSITIAFAETTPPVFTDIVNITILGNYSLLYDIDATDETLLDTFRINDTGNFVIDGSTGVLSNVTTLSEQIYSLNVTVNDSSNNNVSEIIWINVTAQIFNNTDQDEYLDVSSCVLLQNISNYLNYNYELTQNIDCSDTVNWNGGEGFDPIGTSGTPFTGNFNGSGFNISGLSIIRPSENYVGLIGYAITSSISNLGILGSNISGRFWVSSLTGYASQVTMTNVSVSGDITGDTSVGALAGASQVSHISYSNSSAIINGSVEIGGLIGTSEDSSITMSLFNGIMTGAAYAGGLIGLSEDSNISYSIFEGTANGTSYIGGFIGNADTSQISNSISSGNVTAAVDTAGGLIGTASSSNITNSFVTGDVYGDINSGGFVGSTSNSNILYSFMTGNVSGNSIIGGVIGSLSSTTLTDIFWIDSESDATNCYFGGDVGCTIQIESYFEGIVFSKSSFKRWNFESDWGMELNSNPVLQWQRGDFITGPFDSDLDNYYEVDSCTELQNISRYPYVSYELTQNIDCSDTVNWNSGEGFDPIGNSTTPFIGNFSGEDYSITNVSIYRPSEDNVGVFGYVANGSFHNITLTDLNVTGKNNVGGLLGYALDSNFSSSSSTGNINGTNYTGGLCGYIINSSIANSYTTNNVTGTDYVGGLIGAGHNVSVTTSYASGNVVGVDFIGGLGGHFNESNVSSSYAVGIVTGVTARGGVIGELITSTISNVFWSNNSDSALDCYDGGNTNCTIQSNSYFKGSVSLNAPFNNWNFTTIWGAQTSLNPIFKWQSGDFIYVPMDSDSDSYYDIGSCSDLQGISLYLSLNFELTQNIDCSDTVNWNSGEGFDPIGNLTAPFTGNFSGDGFTITNLTVNRSGTSYVGLFGYSSNNTISNITLTNVSIIGGTQTGGLFGMIKNVTATNSFVAGTVSGTIQTGIFVGHIFNSTILSSNSSGTVNGSRKVGGFAGSSLDASMVNSRSYAYANGTSDEIGGFVGYISNSRISDSYATGNVTGDTQIGGLIGETQNSNITNSYATGNVTGDTQIGGLIGETQNSNIINSYATGNINGTNDDIGGLIGYVSGSNITHSYATGNASGVDNIGGLLGNPVNSNITNSYATGDVNGEDYAGGLIGGAFNVNVINSNATGNVVGIRDAGGLIGDVQNVNITNSYATGNATGDTQIGGLVGYATNLILINSSATGNTNGTTSVGGLIGEADYSTITNSYATGNVKGINFVGGLVGFKGIDDSDYIQNAYATGDVNGTDQIGGLVGYSYSPNISNVFSTGIITGTTNVSGSIGFIEFAGQINNVYWVNNSDDATSCHNESNLNCTIQPDSYFKGSVSSKAPFSSWDFIDVWDTQSSTYPVLQWQDLPETPVTTTNPNTGGGSSGSRSSRGVAIQFNYTILTTAAITQNLVKNRQFKFQTTIKNKLENHSITIINGGTDWVEVEIRSEPIVVRLTRGVEKQIDINSDGVLDIAVTFNSFAAGIFQYSIKKIIPKVVKQDTQNTAKTTDTTPNNPPFNPRFSDEEEKETPTIEKTAFLSKNILFGIGAGIISLILIILAILLIVKHKSPKHTNEAQLYARVNIWFQQALATGYGLEEMEHYIMKYDVPEHIIIEVYKKYKIMSHISNSEYTHLQPFIAKVASQNISFEEMEKSLLANGWVQEKVQAAILRYQTLEK